MKFETIKKRLLLESGIVISALAVLGGGVYFLTTLMESYEADQKKLEAKLNALREEKSGLQKKFQKIQENSDLYREVSEKNTNSKLSISRDALKALINEFKTRYFLNAFSVNMAPPQDLADKQYKYKFASMSSSELEATFDAVSDEDIYSLMTDLQDELPGSVRMKQFKIERVNKVTDESLRAIARSGQYSMVKGQMKFTWFGIKPPEPAQPVEAKP